MLTNWTSNNVYVTRSTSMADPFAYISGPACPCEAYLLNHACGRGTTYNSEAASLSLARTGLNNRYPPRHGWSPSLTPV